MKHRNRPRRLGALALAAVVLAALVPSAAMAEGPELIGNGTFDNGHAPWWGTGNLALDSSSGQLCADVPGGTVNPWDVIIGYDGVPLQAGESYDFGFLGSGAPSTVGRALVQLPVAPYTQYLSAAPELVPGGSGFAYTFTSPVDLPNAQVAFQLGGKAEPWRFCLDDVTLTGGAEPPVYVPDTGPRVRVNQVGYLPDGPKNATLVTEATGPLPFAVLDAQGRTLARGSTVPRGLDASSGENVHSIDFGSLRRPAAGLTLVADGETSRPFDIDADIYQRLALDALRFYYPQRSGIEILDALRPGYARPAGHVGTAPNTGDTSVPCQVGVCDYSLDVAGGWYDAGDHGKYVVNGGISVHQLMSEYERGLATGLGLAIPESTNKVPDILDEARWEQEFLLSMRVPAGEPLAGMAHHKIHDRAWTGLPLLPHLDPQPRELHPPSTAATLNLAATAAQAARIFPRFDKAFAKENLAAAKAAWQAALAHPGLYADPNDGTGGGAYNDADVSDEFYWAAAELYLTTGEKQYRDFVLASPHHTGDIWRDRGFDWGNTAQLGRLDLATVASRLPGRDAVRRSVLTGADKYLAVAKAHPYGMPYAPDGNAYDWGSNHQVVNNLIVLATAADISGKSKYADAVVQGMDYILGRNALNISYVTGYGDVAAENQHSRWYADQLNPDLPNPPPGTLAGGPNSGLQDPVAQRLLTGCAPQFCYIDDIESWSTNELTVNWNAPLAWIAGYIATREDC